MFFAVGERTPPDPHYVLSKDGSQKGKIVNMRCRKCAKKGCNGTRMHVKWSDGRTTYPCEKDCVKVDADTLRLI